MRVGIMGMDIMAVDIMGRYPVIFIKKYSKCEQSFNIELLYMTL